jgi:hypothetical protein
VCTPTLRPGGPGPTRAITTTRTLQDGRRNLHRTKDEIQDDSNTRRLPTVYFLQFPAYKDMCKRKSEPWSAPRDDSCIGFKEPIESRCQIGSVTIQMLMNKVNNCKSCFD